MENDPLRRDIHVIRGLIGYHNRMTLPLKMDDTIPGDCRAILFEDDVYLHALETALTLMEREYKQSFAESKEEK